MKKVYTFLAEGFEEVEALSVVDVLRRGGVGVTMVSIMDELEVRGTNGITVKADTLFKDIDCKQADLLFLPGGMPGTTNLGSCKQLTDEIKAASNSGKRLAAICAAPSVLGQLSLLEGKKATCYPGFENELSGAVCVTDGVVTDGLVTTAKGMGFAIDLGLELLRLLVDEQTAETIKSRIQYRI